MTGALVSLTSPVAQVERRLAVLDEIESSETIRTKITTGEHFLIVHSIAKPVGEYWDIVYAACISDGEIMEFVDLEERIWKDYGVRLKEATIERQENDWPHASWPNCKSHTYVRICPKAAL
ncbi:hypothetical protein AB0F36_07800 [Streptomyces sp. NPDC029080]|uniref:hypothetical protein n=1 Tax=Streptomyces sp. NPDC029080 TaxID=3155017 RepID=UPI0033C664B4